MTDHPCNRISIRNDTAELGRLAEFVADFCDAGRIGSAGRFRLTLIVEELATNVIMHGYGLGAEGTIEVLLRHPEGARVELQVEDGAPPFDPFSTVPSVDLTADLTERTVGGLGVHLVRSMAETLDYSFRGGRNVVRVSMLLHEGQDGSEECGDPAGSI